MAGRTTSFGMRAVLSRTMAADRSSRWLGHRFEESLVKQAIGQTLANVGHGMPARILMLGSTPEIEVITRSGLCGVLTAACRGSLELRELSYPVLRDFICRALTTEPVLVIAIGTEKRPAGWPLPDFSKWFVAGKEGASRGHAPFHGGHGALEFSLAGSWLRMDKKGHATLIEPFPLPVPRDKATSGGATDQKDPGYKAGDFDFSWGIWAALCHQSGSADDGSLEAKVTLQELPLGAGSAARLALPADTRRRLGEFVRGPGKVYISTPTVDCSQWLLAESGIDWGASRQVSMVEHSHGWGPSFSLLRFYADANPGDRMLVLRDLNFLDLIEAGPPKAGAV